MFEKTTIADLVIFTPKVFEDDRGFFFESYSQKLFQENGIQAEFVQDNHSKSSKFVLRGLHFQKPPYAQAKLVRVTEGQVLDVAVDLRKNSETYGKHYSLILSGQNKKQLFIPRGFAHGFCTLSDVVEFEYKCDNFYNKDSEAGLNWSDPELAIDWRLGNNQPIMTQRDKDFPFLKDLESPF